MTIPYVTISALPHPGETKVRIHPAPDDTITIIQLGPLAVQFNSDGDALAWAEECRVLISDAIERKLATQ